jgi:hypothetical protein
MKKSIIVALAALTTIFISCDKKNPEPEPSVGSTSGATTTGTPAPFGSLKIEFENTVDTLPLVLGQNFKNPNGDTVKVNMFKYYVSNIVLTKSDNSTFTDANSYYLIDQSLPITSIVTLDNVPVASYKSVSFVIGVDSTRNTSGAQTGALDPAKGMFWNWNTGYIFLKIEGTSPQSGDAAKKLIYHIGGFSGANKGLRTVNLSFGTATANVSTTAIPQVHLNCDISEFFKSPSLINVSTQYFHMSATTTNNKMYADNFSDMITFAHVHN